jgi:hypothetical protein
MRVCERKRPRITVFGDHFMHEDRDVHKTDLRDAERTSVKQHPAPSYTHSRMPRRQGWGLSFFLHVYLGLTGRTGWWAESTNLFWWEHGLRRDCESDRPVWPCEGHELWGPEKMPGCISEDFSNPRLGFGLDCDCIPCSKLCGGYSVFAPNQLRLKSAITTFPATTRVL